MIGGSVLQIKEFALILHRFFWTLLCGHSQPLSLACSPKCTSRDSGSPVRDTWCRTRAATHLNDQRPSL